MYVYGPHFKRICSQVEKLFSLSQELNVHIKIGIKVNSIGGIVGREIHEIPLLFSCYKSVSIKVFIHQQ